METNEESSMPAKNKADQALLDMLEYVDTYLIYQEWDVVRTLNRIMNSYFSQLDEPRPDPEVVQAIYCLTQLVSFIAELHSFMDIIRLARNSAYTDKSSIFNLS